MQNTPWATCIVPVKIQSLLFWHNTALLYRQKIMWISNSEHYFHSYQYHLQLFLVREVKLHEGWQGLATQETIPVLTHNRSHWHVFSQSLSFSQTYYQKVTMWLSRKCLTELLEFHGSLFQKYQVLYEISSLKHIQNDARPQSYILRYSHEMLSNKDFRPTTLPAIMTNILQISGS